MDQAQRNNTQQSPYVKPLLGTKLGKFNRNSFIVLNAIKESEQNTIVDILDILKELEATLNTFSHIDQSFIRATIKGLKSLEESGDSLREFRQTILEKRISKLELLEKDGKNLKELSKIILREKRRIGKPVLGLFHTGDIKKSLLESMSRTVGKLASHKTKLTAPLLQSLEDKVLGAQVNMNMASRVLADAIEEYKDLGGNVDKLFSTSLARVNGRDFDSQINRLYDRYYNNKKKIDEQRFGKVKSYLHDRLEESQRKSKEVKFTKLRDELSDQWFRKQDNIDDRLDRRDQNHQNMAKAISKLDLLVRGIVGGVKINPEKIGELGETGTLSAQALLNLRLLNAHVGVVSSLSKKDERLDSKRLEAREEYEESKFNKDNKKAEIRDERANIRYFKDTRGRIREELSETRREHRDIATMSGGNPYFDPNEFYENINGIKKDIKDTRTGIRGLREDVREFRQTVRANRNTLADLERRTKVNAAVLDIVVNSMNSMGAKYNKDELERIIQNGNSPFEYERREPSPSQDETEFFDDEMHR